MSEWVKTDWVCTYCGGVLLIKPLYKLKLDIVCNKCGKHFESDVNLHIPYNSQSITHRDKPTYVAQEQYA